MTNVKNILQQSHIKKRIIALGIVRRKANMTTNEIQKTNPDYIPGVHCGDKNCYACGTQRYNCNDLNKLDVSNDELQEKLELEHLVDNNPDDGSWIGR